MPQFQSPGGNAGDAIQAFLIQRAMMQRQAKIDEQNAEAQKQEMQQRAAELKLRQEEQKRLTEQQRTQTAGVESEREFRKASTLAERALPGDQVDPQTAALLRGQGFGSQIQQGLPTQGADLGVDENQIPQYQVIPGVMEMRGGSQYMNARAAEEARATAAREAQAARAAEGDLTRQAKAEQATQANQTREEIARMGAAGATETRGLRNQLLEQQVAAAKDKQAETATAATNKRNAVKQPALEALALIDDIEKDPGFSSAVGARIPGLGIIAGTPAATAITRIDRLKGLLDIDLIAQMKAQSRTGATGFGAMSAPELKILEDAAARLSRNQSEASFREELTRLKTKLQQVVQEPGGTNTSNAGRVYYDMDGNPVPR